MSENIINSPTTGSTDELLSHGMCMAADIFIHKNNNNCKLICVNGSALNGEDGGGDNSIVKSMDHQAERSVESGSSSSASSISNSSSTSSGSSSASSTSSSSSSSSNSSTSHQSLPVNKSNNPNQEAAWACKICNFTHKWPLIMINHLRIFHKLESPFDQYIFKMDTGLTESSSSTAKSTELVTYQPTSTNIKCKLCDTAFETAQDLEEHNEHLHSDLVWACRSCSFSNKWQQLAISHLRSAHNCHPPYTDHLYRKNSDKTSSILQRIQSASLNFRSHLYPSPSQQQQQQKQSQQSHQPPQSNPSTISLVSPSSSLAQENTNNVKEQLNNNDVKSNNSNNNDKNGDLVNNESNMTTESVNKSPSPGVEMDSELKTATKDCYRRLDNDRFQCMNCGKTCGSAQGITEHYEAYHLGLNYQCKLCRFTDLWRSMLTKHLKVKHNLGKPYEKFLRRVKVETNPEDNQMISPYRRRRSRAHNNNINIKESDSPEPESISSPKQLRQSSSTSTSTLVPTSSSTTTKRSSNSQQQQQQPQVKTTKRGRKPKDKLAIKAKTAKSKRRRSKKTPSY